MRIIWNIAVLAACMAFYACSDGGGNKAPQVPNSQNLQNPGGGGGFFSPSANCPTNTFGNTTPTPNTNNANQNGANAQGQTNNGTNGANANNNGTNTNNGNGFGSFNLNDGFGNFGNGGTNNGGTNNGGTNNGTNNGAANNNNNGFGNGGTQNTGNNFGSANNTFGAGNCPPLNGGSIQQGQNSTNNPEVNDWLNKAMNECNQKGYVYDHHNEACTRAKIGQWCTEQQIVQKFGNLGNQAQQKINEHKANGHRVEQCGEYESGDLLVYMRQHKMGDGEVTQKFTWICSNAALCPKM